MAEKKRIVFRRVNQGGRSRIVPIEIKSKNSLAVGVGALASGGAAAILGGKGAGKLARIANRELNQGRSMRRFVLDQSRGGGPYFLDIMKKSIARKFRGQVFKRQSRFVFGATIITSAGLSFIGLRKSRQAAGDTPIGFTDAPASYAIASVLTTAAYLGTSRPNIRKLKVLRKGIQRTTRMVKKIPFPKVRFR